MRKTALRTLAILSALLPLAACGGGSPSAPSGPARLQIRLTDAPTNGATAINVHIVGLMIKRAGDIAAEKITNDVGIHDLLQLQGTSALLAAAEVDPGDYEFVQVELDQSDSTVTEESSGDTVPVRIASEEIKVLGGFTVMEDHTTTVLLDFDAQASLRHLGNGDWVLTPVISQANVSMN